MCSIFGFIARGKDRVSIKSLSAIVDANIVRGPHSFGLSWIDPNGRLHCYKQQGRMTDHLSILAMVRDARMVIGHLRYATHGEPDNNINNHPHPADGGWIVHNGVIRNYSSLVRQHGLKTVSECDSESLGLMIERSDSANLMTRCADSIQETDGGLCMLGLWSRPGSLIAARRGNPLHYSETISGIYLATLRHGLPGKPGVIADDTIRLFRRNGTGITVRRKKLEPTDEVGGIFDGAGRYSGG